MIYELIEAYRKSETQSRRIVGEIIHNLNDRRGIKQELRACDDAVITEMFEALEKIVIRVIGT